MLARLIILIILVVVALEYAKRAQATTDTGYVQPFLGTEGGGNMFPGVAMPFGMVKIGIDILPPPGAGDPYSGYAPTGNVTGFSMMHESGTGGSPKYGVVSQLPVVGNVQNPLLDYSLSRAAPDEATLGYYKASLSNGATVELTAATHSGMMRHTFPADSEAKNVLVDVSHYLPSFRGLGFEQHYGGGSIKVLSGGKYTGHGIYSGGWNYAPNWKIFFCGQFATPPAFAATFQGTDEKLQSFGQSKSVAGSNRIGAIFTFKPSNTRVDQRELQNKRQTNGYVVESRVGISFISTAKACGYIDNEIPKSTGAFQSLVQAVNDTWAKDVFSVLTTTDKDPSMLRLLYSSIYGMFLIPSDRSGENPLWSSSEPYYDDIFTLWDIFRSHTPLFHILQPKRYADFIRSLIDMHRREGWLPDARSSNYIGRTQGGSNADNVLADAHVKGITDGINWDDGYAAMVTDAEKIPPNNNDRLAPDSSTKEGRGALPDWLSRGFITTKYTRSVTRASEYSFNDFALSQVAKSLGKIADYKKYATRSKNWQHHWDNRSTIYGFTGFLSPIDATGSFASTPQNPLSCGGCYWGDAYYQALPYEYSFNAHHDMKTLIEFMGGDSAFIARLSKMFEPNSNPNGDARFDKTIFNPGNEPSFATPYLFNFVPGNQWRSVEATRHVVKSYYNSGKTGLPGNSDSGAMQSWLLWSIIGLYPITGTTTFLIGSPQLKQLSINLGGGKKFSITSNGGDEGNGVWFVQSLKVNGKTWNKSWVEWDDIFANGGTMEFVLGSQKEKWDTGERPLWGIV